MEVEKVRVPFFADKAKGESKDNPYNNGIDLEK